MHFAGDKKIKN